MKRRDFLKYVAAAVGGAVVATAVDRTVFMAPSQQTTVAKPSITVATWGGPWADEVTKLGKSFQEKFGSPVLVQVHPGPSSATLEKIRAAWPNYYGVDVYMAGDFNTQRALVEGYLEPISQTDVPSISDYPDAVIGKGTDGNPYWISMYTYGGLFGYRADVISNPPGATKDLENSVYVRTLGAPHPTYWAAFLIELAYANGGSEFNMDPAFEAAKRLANMKIIKSVFNTDADARNLLSTGEAPIVHSIPGNYVTLAQQGLNIQDVKQLADTPIIFNTDALCVIKGPKSDVAKQFAQFILSSDNISEFCNAVGFPTASTKGNMSPEVEKLNLSAQDLVKIGKTPDKDQYVNNIDSWSKRWDSEVAPLI